MISMRIDNPQAVEAAFEGRAAFITEAVRRRLDALDVLLQSRIQNDALSGGILQNHTQGLKNSVRAIPVTAEGDMLVGIVEAGGTGRGGAPWARLLEEGSEKTGNYLIQAKGGGALAFILGSKLVLVKSVQHPYMRAFHFMSKTQESMAAEIILGIQAAAFDAATVADENRL